MDIEQVKVRVLPDGRIPRADAAKYLGLSPATLASWAVRGIGPRHRRVGSRSYYYLRDLEAFVSSGARQDEGSGA